MSEWAGAMRIDPIEVPVAPMARAELDYRLEEGRIATRPAEPRDSARLMVVHLGGARGGAGPRVEHCLVRDLPKYVRPTDTVVVNRTRVAPARFVGRRVGDGRETEGLCLQPTGARTWSAMLRGAKRFRAGDWIELLAPARAPVPGGLSKTVLPKHHCAETTGDTNTSRDRVKLLERTPDGVILEFEDPEPARVLERSGWTPLPPYIVAARAESMNDEDDRAWYQTVYAAAQTRPSVAAPTAGLHFTPELLGRVKDATAQVLEVELQVGPGTFKPVTAERLCDHPMHAEWCLVPSETTAALRALPGRVLAVGTTSVRVLESLPRPLPDAARAIALETSLLLAPGAQFRWVDVLLTNFHLPGSTLLALVGAFAGLDLVKDLYAQAQRDGYRFYSYGDAMLLIRGSS
ncbi:MAG: tRNA preQ1(34) S-adenosylmethionine ribosyltransferase-isomerase QueA [Planctomycetota bacterium]|nr:tRNA preQ1(34) S-adenosylmethionine ribosyltransferase-isomerase QueA [Planctomycetota bacterium]